MFISNTSTRAELEAAINAEHQLEADLNSIAAGYGFADWTSIETDDLRDMVRAWIEQGDECAA